MSLYICDTCDGIENTVYGNYVLNQIKSSKEKNKCSECLEGKWHSKFPKRIATPEIIEEIGKENFEYLGKFENMLGE
jgi:hypothetical protein